MRLDSKIVVEVVSALAVVASLLFVGMQLILDRRVAIAQQYHSRAEYRAENARAALQSEARMSGLAKSWEEGFRPTWWTEEIGSSFPTSWDSAEFSSALLDLDLAFYDYDNIHYQYEQGLLSEDLWQGMRENLKQSLSSPPIRGRFFERVRRSEMRELMQELVREIDQ